MKINFAMMLNADIPESPYIILDKVIYFKDMSKNNWEKQIVTRKLQDTDIPGHYVSCYTVIFTILKPFLIYNIEIVRFS